MFQSEKNKTKHQTFDQFLLKQPAVFYVILIKVTKQQPWSIKILLISIPRPTETEFFEAYAKLQKMFSRLYCVHEFVLDVFGSTYT